MDSSDIQGIARHVLTTAGGVLVTNGYLTSGQLQDLIGAALVIGGIVWSLWSKRSARAAIATAAATGVVTKA